MGYNISTLIVFLLFVSCQGAGSKKGESVSGAENLMYECYVEHSRKNSLPIFKDHQLFEKFLIDNKYLEAIVRDDYIRLFDDLVNGDLILETNMFLKTNPGSTLFMMPVNLGVERSCLENVVERFPNQEVFSLMHSTFSQMRAVGNFKDYAAIKGILDSISDNDFKKPVYRITLNTLMFKIASEKEEICSPLE